MVEFLDTPDPQGTPIRPDTIELMLSMARQENKLHALELERSIGRRVTTTVVAGIVVATMVAYFGASLVSRQIAERALERTEYSYRGQFDAIEDDLRARLSAELSGLPEELVMLRDHISDSKAEFLREIIDIRQELQVLRDKAQEGEGK